MIDSSRSWTTRSFYKSLICRNMGSDPRLAVLNGVTAVASVDPKIFNKASMKQELVRIKTLLVD